MALLATSSRRRGRLAVGEGTRVLHTAPCPALRLKAPGRLGPVGWALWHSWAGARDGTLSFPKTHEEGKGKEGSCLTRMIHFREKQGSVVSGGRQAGKCCSWPQYLFTHFSTETRWLAANTDALNQDYFAASPAPGTNDRTILGNSVHAATHCSSFWHHPREAAGRVSPFQVHPLHPDAGDGARKEGAARACVPEQRNQTCPGKLSDKKKNKRTKNEQL